MRVSITDVAKEAGVSIATASKALNGTGSIGSDTVKRVMETAQRMGYQPNRAAQLLASKNKTIGVVMPTEPSEVYSLFEKGLLDALDEYMAYGIRFRLRRFTRNAADFRSALLEMQDVNGLIFLPAIDDFREELLSDLPMPKVALQTAAASLCPFVTVDAEMTGRMAADMLSFFTGENPGVTAIITGSRSIDIHRKNVHGFLSTCAERGLTNVDIRDSYDRFSEAYTITDELLHAHGNLTGIFVSSYVAPAVCACLKDRGRTAGMGNTPADRTGGQTNPVRVVGVDVTAESAACLRDGSLTAAIYQNQPWQAKKSVELLFAMMREEPVDSVRIKPELVLSSNLLYYL